MILITGNARSGTNFLGEILNSHPDMVCDIEAEPQFDLVTKQVVFKQDNLFSVLVDTYKTRIETVKPKIFASKDHHSIWLAERLLTQLPVKFLYIERDPYAVVASSLRHKGVTKWVVQNFPQNPLSANYITEYVDMTTVERLTLRWILHHQLFTRLVTVYPANFYYVNYENLILNTKSVLEKMSQWLQIDNKFEVPAIKANVLTKWRKDLTFEEKDLIKHTIDKYLNYAN